MILSIETPANIHTACFSVGVGSHIDLQLKADDSRYWKPGRSQRLRLGERSNLFSSSNYGRASVSIEATFPEQIGVAHRISDFVAFFAEQWKEGNRILEGTLPPLEEWKCRRLDLYTDVVVRRIEETITQFGNLVRCAHRSPQLTQSTGISVTWHCRDWQLICYDKTAQAARTAKVSPHRDADFARIEWRLFSTAFRQKRFQELRSFAAIASADDGLFETWIAPHRHLLRRAESMVDFGRHDALDRIRESGLRGADALDGESLFLALREMPLYKIQRKYGYSPSELDYACSRLFGALGMEIKDVR